MTTQKMHGNYENSWTELNSRLREIEIGGGGLDAALSELETHQKESGFIKADLAAVKRFSFSHPENSSRFFRIQYNPVRALRFNGSGVSSPPPGTSVRNEGCFLCRDNIRWQQQGTEMGYEIHMGETSYYAWMNPFPLLPTHVVIATREHTSQEWPVCEKGNLDVSELLNDFVELAVRMPSYIGFYNGVNAGVSIPSHLHFQFFKRPEDEPEFPLERAARWHLESGEQGIFLKDYPLAVAMWTGEPRTVLGQASEWIAEWAGRNPDRIHGLTANFVVSSDNPGDSITLFFVPRDRAKTHDDGGSRLIGGFEALGELVVSSKEDKALLDAGKIDYFSLEKTLASVRTPFFLD